MKIATNTHYVVLKFFLTDPLHKENLFMTPALL